MMLNLALADGVAVCFKNGLVYLEAAICTKPFERNSLHIATGRV